MFLTLSGLFSFFAGPRTSLLKVGDTPPDFALPDQNGRHFVMHDQIGQHILVIYFYPKDETRGCTKEACGFRDHFEAFTEAGAKVIGINAASPEKHKKFAAHHRLPFSLLSDPGNKVGAAFGVASLFGMSARETFVIGKTGKIEFHFSSLLQFDKHVTDALAVIEKLQKK